MKVDAPRYPWIAVLALIAGVAVPALAPADEAADRKAEAQRLFTEGQAALEKGDNATACTLMRKSLALFAVANSLFNVAQCDERDGKLASALERWKRGMSLVDATDKRAPIVKKAIDDLEVRVPRVRILVEAKHEPLEVVLDDEVMPKDKLVAALLVDPGKHVVTVRKKDHEDRRVEILLNERERTEVVAEPGTAKTAPVPTASAAPPHPPGPNPLKVGGFVALGGIGAVGLAGAAITGGMIVSNHMAIENRCGTDKICESGLPSDLINQQEILLPANALFWGVSIVGAATGTVLLVLSNRAKKDSLTTTAVPLILNQGGGIGLSGRF